MQPLTQTEAPTVQWNRAGIGPFGTYSISVTAGYTDTSSLPLGFEQAANLLQPESEIQTWCRTESFGMLGNTTSFIQQFKESPSCF